MSTRPLVPRDTVTLLHWFVIVLLLVLGRCADAVEHARIEAMCRTQGGP